MRQYESTAMRQMKKTGEITGGNDKKKYEETNDPSNKEDKKPPARNSISKREKWIDTVTRLIDFF